MKSIQMKEKYSQKVEDMGSLPKSLKMLKKLKKQESSNVSRLGTNKREETGHSSGSESESSYASSVIQGLTYKDLL